MAKININPHVYVADKSALEKLCVYQNVYLQSGQRSIAFNLLKSPQTDKFTILLFGTNNNTPIAGIITYTCTGTTLRSASPYCFTGQTISSRIDTTYNSAIIAAFPEYSMITVIYPSTCVLNMYGRAGA